MDRAISIGVIACRCQSRGRKKVSKNENRMFHGCLGRVAGKETSGPISNSVQRRKSAGMGAKSVKKWEMGQNTTCGFDGLSIAHQ